MADSNGTGEMDHGSTVSSGGGDGSGSEDSTGNAHNSSDEGKEARKRLVIALQQVYRGLNDRNFNDYEALINVRAAAYSAAKNALTCRLWPPVLVAVEERDKTWNVMAAGNPDPFALELTPFDDAAAKRFLERCGDGLPGLEPLRDGKFIERGVSASVTKGEIDPADRLEGKAELRYDASGQMVNLVFGPARYWLAQACLSWLEYLGADVPSCAWVVPEQKGLSADDTTQAFINGQYEAQFADEPEDAWKGLPEGLAEYEATEESSRDQIIVRMRNGEKLEVPYRGANRYELSRPIDWPKWLELPLWGLGEAVCLMKWVAPEKADFWQENGMGLRSWHAIELYKRAILALNARDLEVLGMPGTRLPPLSAVGVRPVDFVRWAAGLGCEVPEPLRGLLEADGKSPEQDSARPSDTERTPQEPQKRPAETSTGRWPGPAPIKWSDIEMKLPAGQDADYVNIRVRKGPFRKIRHDDISRKLRGKNGPAEAVQMLLLFAASDARGIPLGDDETVKRKYKMQLSRLRDALRGYFNLEGDPFPYNRKSTTWGCAFSLRRAELTSDSASSDASAIERIPDSEEDYAF